MIVMKIGEFARKYGIPKDTIRYYIRLGLLLPHIVGSQLDFSPTDGQDLLHILQFKQMRMNLADIRSLLYLRRMSNVIEPG